MLCSRFGGYLPSFHSILYQPVYDYCVPYSIVVWTVSREWVMYGE